MPLSGLFSSRESTKNSSNLGRLEVTNITTTFIASIKQLASMALSFIADFVTNSTMNATATGFVRLKAAVITIQATIEA